MAKGVLNPADRARKEARKKELKKNKKQRQQVRSAVIENRNPEQILADLEQLDQREYDPEKLKRQQQDQGGGQSATSSQFNVNTDLLYAEKRKRLKDLFAKCLAHYEKEDPERHAKLKSLEASYEAKQKKIKIQFEAVKRAAEVSVDEVILPPEPVTATVEVPPSAHHAQQQIQPQLHLLSGLIRGPPPTGTIRQPFGNPRAGCPPSFQEQQAHKRPRFVPSQARNSQRPPQQPGKPTETSPSKPAADSGSAGLTAPPAKQAVIESKPVIFMPKATKFVPASVRAKIRPTGPRADAD